MSRQLSKSDQVAASAELGASDLFTAIACQAQSVQAARWRLTNFLRHANELLDPDPLLDLVRKAIGPIATHSKRILQRWTSSHSNARLEGLNGLLQAARARARGYRNITTFATIIYLLAALLGEYSYPLDASKNRDINMGLWYPDTTI